MTIMMYTFFLFVDCSEKLAKIDNIEVIFYFLDFLILIIILQFLISGRRKANNISVLRTPIVDRCRLDA